MAWVLRDLYEVVPNDYIEAVSGGRAGVQYVALGGSNQITGVAWYRGSTSDDPPVSLSVWDRQQTVRLWKTTDVPDDGTVGWHEVDLTDTPLIVVRFNAQVGAGGYWADGGQFSAKDQSADLSGEVGGNVPLQFAFHHEGSGDVVPATVATSRIYPFDIRVEPWAGVSAGAGAGVDAALASYLTSAGANYAGNPIADIKTTVENTFNDVEDGTFGLAAIKDDTALMLTRWSSALATKLNDTADAITTALTVWTSDLAASIAAGMAKLEELWSDILACFASTPGALLCVVHAYLKFLRDLTGPPEAAWIVDAETDFTDSLEWPVQADQYRVFVETFDARGSSQTVGTHTRYVHFGKWTTMDVDVFGEWHYFSQEQSKLEDGGRRMPGLALILEHGGTGHVQALLRPEV